MTEPKQPQGQALGQSQRLRSRAARYPAASRRGKKPVDPTDSDAATLAALRSLARADQSRAALTRKLQFKGFDLPTIETALSALERQGWLSESRALNALWERSRAKGIGPQRILGQMRQKGFNAQAAAATIATDASATERTDEYWVPVACAALSRRFKDQALLEPKRVQQALRFLAQRGFTLAQGRAALAQYHQSLGAPRGFDAALIDPSEDA
jgi:regulatory protein